MPPRDSQLPEGTDHIINGAMETGAGTGASTGSSATGGTSGSGGGSSSGFIGGAGVTVSMGDGTGGTASGGAGSSGGGSSSGGSSGATGKLAGQVRDQVQGLKSQATDKVRQYADQGKERADSVLDNFNQVVQEAARSVDERLGAEYGQYAHRAADAVSSLADGLRAKSVDDLLNDSRDVIRRSPGVAIGAAALIGFALTRVVKAGIPADDNDVDFTPDRQLTAGTTSGTAGGTTGGTTASRTTTTTTTTTGTGV
jgi:ElaB/YqjD/DUF883 family membrane-anchored ribosome-binding protein